MKFFDVQGNEVPKPPEKEVIWRVSSYVVLTDKNKLYMIKSDYNPADQYELPGGGVETWEGVQEGARREMLEETGLDVALDEAPCFFTESGFHESVNDEFWHTIRVYYRGSIKSVVTEDPVSPDETVLWRGWVDVDELTKENCQWASIEPIEKLFDTKIA